MKELRVGMIGYGFMGRTHSNAYKRLNDFFPVQHRPVLKAICARNAEKALAPDGFLIMNTYSPTVDFDSIAQLSELYFPDREKEVAELVMITTTGKHLYFGNLLRVKPKLISEEDTY